MKMNYIEDIREEFRRRKASGLTRGNTIEIQNAHFRVDAPVIFGVANEKYQDAERVWYQTQSLDTNTLFKLYGKEVEIWKNISDKDGFINSNYGWCIFSRENNRQYSAVRHELTVSPDSRRAVMYYTRPTMHVAQHRNGMQDHICTTNVQYFVNDGYLECQVNMRSNDAIFGFLNDCDWQRYILHRLAQDLNLKTGSMTWSAGSLHIYDRHWDLIK